MPTYQADKDESHCPTQRIRETAAVASMTAAAAEAQ